MGINQHPNRGSVVVVDYSTGGFVPPEMVKRRLAIVLSPKITSRPKLCTIVPLSKTEPDKVMPYHAQIKLPFRMPSGWGDDERWVKGDMVNAVSFHRVELLRFGKDKYGKRRYLYDSIPDDMFRTVQRCALHGMGMSNLTKHLK